MLQLKASYYNYYFPYRGGMLLFNGVSRALSFLPIETYLELRPELLSTNPINSSEYEGGPLESVIEELRQGRFLIDADRNELEYLRRRTELHKQIQPFSLTIATTMDCNLACYYCYEEKYGSYMSRDVCDLVYRYVVQHVEKHQEKHLYLTWFGGEPMLNTDCIEYLSARLIPLCREQNIRYHASIVSNGTCWPDRQSEIIAFIERNLIESVQFTFDGLPENHNRRRRHARHHVGPSSFESMSRTISALIGHLNINLRLHCDSGNARDLFPLVDSFVERGWLYRGSKVFPYAAPVVPVSETCDFLQKKAIDAIEFSKLGNDFRRYVAKFVDPVEYAGSILPRSVKVVCSAVSPNNIMVGPDGRLYKCLGDIGAHDKSHGHIRELVEIGHGASPFRIIPDTYAMGSCVNDYAAFDVFSQPTCSVCKYLPLCMSGCPKQQLERYRAGGNQPTIDRNKQYWDNCLETLVTDYADLMLRDPTESSSPRGQTQVDPVIFPS